MTSRETLQNDERPEVTVGRLLSAAGKSLAVAESCTGGLLASVLTDVPGSSDYFLGGIVSYHDSAKVALLGVDPKVIKKFGAVSRQCAASMAEGARRAFGADVGLSTTGIAGPGGGTPEKPVGTVYIGLSAPDYARVDHFIWNSDRKGNKRKSAEAALTMLIEVLRAPDQSTADIPARPGMDK